MVLRALEEARHMCTAPVSLYIEVLLQRIKEVVFNSVKMFPYNYITYLFECFFCLFLCKCVKIIPIIQIEEADSDAHIKSGWVLDNFPRTNSQMHELQLSGILPDSLFCLSDPDENHGVRLNANNHPSNVFY